MSGFTPEEIDEIDALWRDLPADHVWSGWAATGERPEEIWIFRSRNHWRRFPLTKIPQGFALSDEGGKTVADGQTLVSLLKKVEAIPGLKRPENA